MESHLERDEKGLVGSREGCKAPAWLPEPLSAPLGIGLVHGEATVSGDCWGRYKESWFRQTTG